MQIPKFKIEYGTKPLVQSLDNLGMKRPFEEYNFGNMHKSEFKACWWIGDVFHKSFINVDEKGTEAAAASAVIILKSTSEGNSDEYYFNANRPFLYFIAERNSGIILFAGIMQDPS